MSNCSEKGVRKFDRQINNSLIRKLPKDTDKKNKNKKKKIKNMN